MNTKIKQAVLLSAALGTLPVSLSAGEVYNKGGNSVEFNIEAMIAAFSSEENYTGVAGDRHWREGYIQADVVANSKFDYGTLYGGFGLIALGTTGDGDALGITVGDEGDVDVENAYIGWKSDSGLIDFSVGRQTFTIGDGFIVAGDKVSPGEGFGSNIDRGGAYYLAGRKSFGGTAILKVDPEGPLRGDLFWLKSNSDYQQDTELTGINIELVDDSLGTLGFTYMEVTDVDAGKGLGIFDTRDGMEITSIRGQGSAGVENLLLSFEYVKQREGDTAIENDAEAWYLEGGYTFANAMWSPTLNYRFGEFSGDDASTATKNEAFDPLFYGFTRGFGTWYQGEVAANYSGPFSSGNDFKRVELTLAPRNDLQVGIQHWSFDKVDDALDLKGTETDIFALWTINDNLVFSPLIGSYKPKGSDVIAAQGNDDRNLYMQAILMFFF